MTGALARTLWALRRRRVRVNATTLAKIVGTSPPAMANRLVRLEELGLAERFEDGRQNLWRARP